MIFKKKYVCIALGALMVSGLAFGKFGADSKIQEVKAEEQSITWNFSDDVWQSELSVMGDPGRDITTTWDITVNGLNFYSTQKNRWNTTYIQLAGKGSKTDRVFTFEADYPGTLEITASNTGSSEDLKRNVVVQLEDDDDSIQKQPAGYASSNPQTVSFDINSGVQKVYPDSALRIYEIKYTFNVPTRTLLDIYIAGTATKLNYTSGDEFDPAGLKVMGRYSSGDDTEIMTGIVWTFSPEVLTADTTSVTVTATVNEHISEPFTVNNLVVKRTIADVLPDDFPVVYDGSIPENAWVNENGINLTLYYDELVLKTSDSTRRLGLIEDVSSAVLIKNGDNYLISDEYKQITFNCVDNIATSVKVEGLSGSYAAYSDFNGTYSEPGIKDSYQDLTTSMSARTFIEDGVITISGEKDGYRMELELYTDPAVTMIPAGAYVISDLNEAGTALKSEGFKDGAPLKSYIALLDNGGNITDCWLLIEGTIILSYNQDDKMTVTVDATNSKGKSISVSAIVCDYYTVTIGVNDQTMGSVSLTTIEDVVENTIYSVNGNTLSVGQEEITPTANEGYEFDCWKIGDTKVTLQGTITENTTFTAVFKEIPVTTYKVTFTATNGTVSRQELTDVTEGTQYSVNGNKLTVGDTEITATPNEGYEFDCWKIGETKVVDNGTITTNTTFTATFKVIEEPIPEPEDNGLSGGAIAGIAVGAVAAVVLISYAVMFAVYAKTGKGLKFLSKSFDWLKKLFKMK